MPNNLYIDTTDGDIEIINRNVSGGHDARCPDCDRVCWQSLVAISNLRGYIYMCTFCGRQTTDDS